MILASTSVRHHGRMKTKSPTFKQTPLSDVMNQIAVTTLPWFEVFYAGKHTDRHGKEYEFTRADLEQMVTNFKPDTVPFLINHPDADSPSYGFAKAIKLTEDNRLFLEGVNVSVEFAKAVMGGNYSRRSNGIRYTKDTGWYIDHVAFLGAQAPALDNLSPVGHYTFSVSADDTPHQFDFSIETQTANTLTRFMRSVRDFFIAEKGQEEADRIVDTWEVEWLQKQVAREEIKDENDPLSEFSNPKTPEDKMTGFTQAQLDAAATKAADDAATKVTADFQQKLDDAEKTTKEAEQKAKELEFSQSLKDCQALVDKTVAEGRLVPAAATGLAEFMAQVKHLPSETPLEFEFSRGEGDKAKKVKSGLFEYCQELLENIGKPSPLGPVPDLTTEPDAILDNNDLDKKAMEYQKQHSCTYEVAVDAVLGVQ